MRNPQRFGTAGARNGITAGITVLAVLLLVNNATAADLRGRVDGQNAYTSIPTPVNGMSVELANANGSQVLSRYVTGPDGFYYFRNIPPGTYQLRAGGRVYPLVVQQRPAQDIAPIRIQF